MRIYQHNIAELFARRDCAETALSKLMQKGLPSDQLRITAINNRSSTAPDALRVSRGSQINFMLYTVIGATVGFVVGLLVEFVLLVSDTIPLNIFSVASPAMLVGWCVLAGAFLGCAAGTAILWQPSQTEDESDVMLVAKTHTEGETAIARTVIKASAEMYKEADLLIEGRAEVAR
jgi:hypothetical protein